MDRQRLESFHHRCLRAMANITMFDVKEKRIHNEEIREIMGNCYTIHQTMEIDGNQKVEVAREIISDARDSKPQKNLHIMDPTAKTNRKTVPNNQQSVCAHCRRGTKT
eukprot:scaffold18014_cov71-Cylindrotheca_fusiformis.AAC.1